MSQITQDEMLLVFTVVRKLTEKGLLKATVMASDSAEISRAVELESIAARTNQDKFEELVTIVKNTLSFFEQDISGYEDPKKVAELAVENKLIRREA